MDEPKRTGSEQGTINQEVGEWAHHEVQARLASDGFAVGTLRPDLGEDVVVEVDGHTAARDGSHPLRALLQVRGHEKRIDAAIYSQRCVETKHLRRWAAHALPVYLVVVSGYRDSRGPTYFVRAIDDYLTDRHDGIDLDTLVQDSAVIRVQRTSDLSRDLREAIEAFYHACSRSLQTLSSMEVEEEHFEILDVGTPDFRANPMVARIKQDVLWKSPYRPYYFSKLRHELARRAADRFRGSEYPVEVVHQIYRSLAQRSSGTTTAVICWRQIDHDRAPEVPDWCHSGQLTVHRETVEDRYVRLLSEFGRQRDGENWDAAHATLGLIRVSCLPGLDPELRTVESIKLDAFGLHSEALALLKRASRGESAELSRRLRVQALRCLTTARLALECELGDRDGWPIDTTSLWLQVELLSLDLGLLLEESRQSTRYERLSKKWSDLFTQWVELSNNEALDRYQRAGLLDRLPGWSRQMLRRMRLAAPLASLEWMIHQNGKLLDAPETILAELQEFASAAFSTVGAAQEDVMREIFGDPAVRAEYLQRCDAGVERLLAHPLGAALKQVISKEYERGLEPGDVAEIVAAARSEVLIPLVQAVRILEAEHESEPAEAEANRIVDGMHGLVFRVHAPMVKALLRLERAAAGGECVGKKVLPALLDECRAVWRGSPLVRLVEGDWVELAVARSVGDGRSSASGNVTWEESCGAVRSLDLAALRAAKDVGMDVVNTVFLAFCYLLGARSTN